MSHGGYGKKDMPTMIIENATERYKNKEDKRVDRKWIKTELRAISHTYVCIYIEAVHSGYQLSVGCVLECSVQSKHLCKWSAICGHL